MSDVEDTADLITRLNAKAIVEAYRAGKELREAKRDRLRAALESIIEIADRPAVITIAPKALQEDKEDD